MLKKYCTICNFSDDGFVGIGFRNNLPFVSFPRGYKLSEGDEEIRRDIIGLINVLRKFSKHQDGDKINSDGSEKTNFPIFSYQYIIQNFITHGYYTENEIQYLKNNSGKINWKRTIQKIKPQINSKNIIYIDFITKCSVNKSNILTKIHEFCVYESFLKLGWLYFPTKFLPPKPSIKFNKKMFLFELGNALKNTFNNEKKLLFESMINIINNIDENTKISTKDFQYGVYRFEYVWENLVDYIFGENNKEKYFPRAKWHVINGNLFETSKLEPDIIMKYNDKIFILDAKYYKFGVTGLIKHLPATSSIQKQITYGDFVNSKKIVEDKNIYNAFIMPYSASEEDEVLKFVSVGTADWINYSDNSENYKYVLGILLDTKYVMRTYSKHNEKDIQKMSELIVISLREFRETS